LKKIKPILPVLTVVAATVFSLHCSDSPSQPDQPPVVKDDPSFSADIQPIFNANCTSSSCHGSGASGGLVLLQGQAYANLVDVASIQDPSKKRVLPNNAENSYIVIKLEGRQTTGGRMPLGGSALASGHIQNIKNWINKGAKNN